MRIEARLSGLSILFIIGLYFCNYLSSQSLANVNLESAIQKYEAGDLEKSYQYLSRIKSNALNKNSCDFLKYQILKTDSLMTIGNYKKSAQWVERFKIDKIDCPTHFNLLLIQRALIFVNRRKYERADSLLAKVDNELMENLDTYVKYEFVRFKIEKFKGNPDAKQILEKVLVHIAKNGNINHPRCAPIFANLGNVYVQEADFEKAKTHYKSAREIYERYPKHLNAEAAKMHYNQANVHYEQIELKEALNHYLQAVALWKEDPPDEKYWRYVHEAIGDIYFELNDNDNAAIYWSKAAQILPAKSKDLTENIYQLSDSLSKDNSGQLMEVYNEALQFRKENYGADHPLTAECMTFVGRVQSKQENYHVAAKTYLDAIQIIYPSFELNGIENANAVQKIHDRYTMDALYGLAHVYQQLFYQEKNILYLDTALWIAKISFDGLSDSNLTNLELNSSLFWASYKYPFAELAIHLNYEKYKLSNDVFYLKEAYRYAEMSKSLLLLQSINGQEKFELSEVPEEILNQELEFKREIDLLRINIRNEEKQCGFADLKKIQLWKTHLIQREQAYRDYLLLIRRDYPDFYNLKFSIPEVNISSIQKLLKEENKIMLQFFEGDDFIFSFLLDGLNIKIERVPFASDLEQNIKLYIDDLQGKNGTDNIDWKRRSAFIYNSLLSFWEESLPDSGQLVIIPDGTLSYIPFEAFIVNADNKMDLLANYFGFEYAPSGSLYVAFNATHKVGSVGDVLAMAPDFSPNDNNTIDLPFLLYNKDEVNAICKTLNVRPHLGQAATKKSYLQYAPSSKIIHLATHAIIDEENVMQSSLHFSKEDDTGILYAYEVYNQNLNADLVVLSACNTGSGKFARGEGVLNISRAFHHAGASSVVMSLWSVEDQSTSQLMADFYKYLRGGMDKATALRMAKMDFLNQDDPILAHPFYWSPFILYGDASPIHLAQSKMPLDKWGWIALAIMFLLIVYYYLK